MKRLRFGSALLLLALALGFSFLPVPNASADEGAPKCNCKYPNTDEYGVKNSTGCEVTDCWIDIE